MPDTIRLEGRNFIYRGERQQPEYHVLPPRAPVALSVFYADPEPERKSRPWSPVRCGLVSLLASFATAGLVLLLLHFLLPDTW